MKNGDLKKRNINSIREVSRRNEIYYDFYSKYKLTKEEQGLLIKNYPKLGVKGCVDLFNNKYSYNNILKWAKKLGLRYEFGQLEKWQEDYIINNYGKTKVKEIALHTNLTHSKIERFANDQGLKSCLSNKNLVWTKEEDNTIIEYYPVEGKNVLDRLPGRTVGQIQQRASKLGVKYEPNPWTEEEDNIIKTYYGKEGRKVSKRLPNRLLSSIIKRAKHLEIKNNSKKLWTKEEDDIIKEYYPQEGKNVANRLDRWSDKEIQGRASFLKVKYLKTLPKRVLCVETGIIYESVSSATRLTGIKGVKNVVGKDNYTAGGYHWKYVEEDNNQQET